MGEGSKPNGKYSFIRSFATSCFSVANYEDNRDDKIEVTKEKGSPSLVVFDPEATIIASAKHFSSAHKVRL